MRRWHSAAHARGAAASRGTGQMLGLIVFFIVTGRVGILEDLGSSGLRFKSQVCTLPARWLGQGDEATNKAGWVLSRTHVGFCKVSTTMTRMSRAGRAFEHPVAHFVNEARIPRRGAAFGALSRCASLLGQCRQSWTTSRCPCCAVTNKGVAESWSLQTVRKAGWADFSSLLWSSTSSMVQHANIQLLIFFFYFFFTLA